MPRKLNLKYFLWSALFVLSCNGLIACGGGDNDNSSANANTDNRGELKTSSLSVSHSREAINNAPTDLGDGLQQPGILRYDVDVYRLVYTTLNGSGALVEASGVIALPRKNSQQQSPLLSFQHGTIFYDREAPSNDFSAGAPQVVLAALGFVTLAPDYVGYGESLGEPHPYLLRDPSAAVVIDFLSAASQWLAQNNIQLNEQLFLTGYSQGGYVTMAAHRELASQNNPAFRVTASVPAAGPYDLDATFDELISLDTLFRGEQPVSQRTLSEILTDLVVGQIQPDDSDINFQDTIFEWYLEDGGDGVAAHSVHDWRADVPVRLYHGRDDETVPFVNAPRAQTTMQNRGSADVQVVECLEQPSDHSDCVEPYALYLFDYLLTLAEDL